MHNEEIIKIIDNLKGKRKYEEKKSKKLGYNSLYDYFEDKILHKKKVVEAEKKELELIRTKNNFPKTKKTKKLVVVVNFSFRLSLRNI